MQFNTYSRSLDPTEKQSQRIADEILYHSFPQKEMDEFEDVYYFPDAARLYDRDGNQIDSSVKWGDRRTGPRSDWPPRVPTHRDIPSDLPVVEQPIVFLSVLFPHFGHFMTECISRLWGVAALRDKSIQFLYAESYAGAFWIEGYVAEFMHILSIPLENFLFFETPVLLRRVYVPHPSFILPREAYANHADLPRLAAERVLGRDRPPLRNQPVYFARSRYKAWAMANQRLVVNELELEERLKEEGFYICDLHLLNIHQKIKLFNSHRYFVGTRGSAFFSMMFSLRGEEQEACILYESGRADSLREFCLSQILSRATGHYIGVMSNYVGNILEHKRGRTGPWAGLDDWKIDVPQTISWLSQRGLVRSRVPARADKRPDVDPEQDGLPCGSVTAHFAGRGDVTNEDDLAAGVRYSGIHVQGLSAVVPKLPNDQFEYQVLEAPDTLSDWVPAGTYVGSRGTGIPLLGFAIRLKGEAAHNFEVRYVGTFVGVEDPIWAEDGRLCRAASDIPLEALQVFIRPRDTERAIRNR